MNLITSLALVITLAACEHGKGGGTFTPDGGSGIVCGGFSGATCPSNEWCDFPRDDCGATDGTGTCKPRPLGCPDLFAPVCGCDGTVHSNACDGQALGVDVSVIGSCPPDPGFFSCGSQQCQLDSQYCQRTGSDIGGEPDSFTCNQLPGTCGVTPNCACLAAEPCGDQCSGDAANGFTVICLGG